MPEQAAVVSRPGLFGTDAQCGKLRHITRPVPGKALNPRGARSPALQYRIGKRQVFCGRLNGKGLVVSLLADGEEVPRLAVQALRSDP